MFQEKILKKKPRKVEFVVFPPNSTRKVNERKGNERKGKGNERKRKGKEKERKEKKRKGKGK